MKKLFIPIVAFVVLVCSCSKEASREESIDVKEEVEMVELSFSASTESTKALLDPDNHKSVSFSANDKIAIFKNGNKYEFTTEKGGSDAVFTGVIAKVDLDAEGDFYALFPYSNDATISDGTIENVTLAKYSKATAGTFASQQAIFVAKSSTTTLAFKSAVALLKITVPDGITDLNQLSIYNRAANNITGTFSVTPREDERPSVSVTSGYNTAGLNPNDGGSVISPGFYYIPVLPSNLTSGFDMKLSFNDPDDSFDGRAATGANLTFVAGKIYNLGAIRREKFLVIDGFENESISGSASTTWTGNYATVVSNPFKTTENNSNKVLLMDMSNRASNLGTSGFLDYTIPISGIKGFFGSLSVKVYYDGENGTQYGKRHNYYPRLKWNNSGDGIWPDQIDGNSISDKDSFDNAMTVGEWHTLTWTASKFSKSDLSSLSSLRIRFFVDENDDNLTTGADYGLYVCIDELTFYLK